MSEAFIYYIWQYQYFNKADLVTSVGEPVHIFSPGIRNVNSGPDFLNAKIRLGAMQWVGSVEIHIQSSDWQAHHHDTDEAYENVILHVVWKHNETITHRDGTEVPALELSGRVDENLVFRYKRLLNSAEVIPCSYALSQVKPVVLYGALDKTSASRLEEKARGVLELLDKNRGDWEETCYQLLARNFGFKVNADPFFQLAKALPYKTLLKHGDQLAQVEAMLFGVAGFLEEEEDDDYFKLLRREFNLLRQKYRLDYKLMKRAQWKFLRLRPANFPTLRIAQFAACVASEKNLFSKFVTAGLDELTAIFTKTGGAYWQRHYNFSKATPVRDSSPGESSVANIVINTVVPVLAAYSVFRDDYAHMEKAIHLLHELPAEDNSILRRWSERGIVSKNAFDSQALIELFNNFCTRHRCLDCNIGASLVKPIKS